MFSNYLCTHFVATHERLNCWKFVFWPAFPIDIARVDNLESQMRLTHIKLELEFHSNKLMDAFVR